MEWVKRLGSRTGYEPWRDDFPLTHGLPSHIVLDCGELRLPIHPMLLIRLRVFVDWHSEAGRRVNVLPPEEPAARAFVSRMGLAGEPAGACDVVLPITRLRGYADVEGVAEKDRTLLEYDMVDVAELGQACYMAVSELCGNAIEHGHNSRGAYYVAASRRSAPRRQVSIAIGDLGIGIPEHLRQQEPELVDDDFAIARAMEPRVSGTGHPHRGNGYSETFEAALSSTLHAARIEVYSAGGWVRREIVQERDVVHPFPAPQFRRGTWIVYDLVSARP